MVGLLKRIIPRRFRKNIVEIPVVRLHGMIMDSSSPMRQTLSLGSCATMLEKAFSDKNAPAIAISINSPGGSPVQSRLIYRRIRDLAEEKNKRVLVFVEDVAASGGYMIACAGDEIFADPSSIVGSIGVVSSSFGFTELIKKIGVERRVHTAGQNKATLDPFKPEKPEDILHLKALQLEIHETFIDLVKERRSHKLQEEDTLFTGMFWTGKKGKDLGLVDELADLRSIIKQRFGKNAKMKLISPAKGLLGRKAPTGIAAEIVASAVDSAMLGVEERALWQRFGL